MKKIKFLLFNTNMKKIKFLLFIAMLCTFASCYSVGQVGNCKYYTPKFKSSYYKQHKPIGF